MQGDGKKRLWTLPLLLGAGLMASAVAEENAERSKEGFIEGSEVNLLLRNFYFNRDFRKGQSSPAGGGYTEEWVQGFMANFSSGFTQGTLGVGIDAFAQLGVRLDSGGGRSGAGGSVDLQPYDDQGRPQDNYSRAGGAVKLRWYGTVLRVGDVFPETPVIQYGNSRLFPSSFRGFTLVNDSLAKGLTLQAGKLNSMTQPNSTSGSDDFYSFYTGRRIDSPWVAYAGGDYQATEHWSVSLYGSRQKDAWDQYYAGTSFNYPLDDKLSLLGGANYYKVKDQGRQVMGELDNDIWSVRGGFAYGPHQVLLSYQRNNGDDDFDYLRQTDSIYLDNSIQYSDFNSPKERSLMLRYDLDMAAFGVPGLSFMTRYGKGWDADYSNANSVYMRTDANGNPLTNQGRWERDVEVKYVVQGGAAKDLAFRVRQATVRSDSFESDLDEVRLIVEYPLQVL
ncbi:MAG: OprD family porin [Pseudomonas aeruginosa]|uniref:OprD family porin n=1 Tax=Pseudomonas aeruginosa TaxID=287 RepID=UPI0015D98F29|nr:OprD family porin [Pseudomonas aeruginosa]EKW1626340.1 OprD family porin [Pseudomonas aeruginosa]MBG4414762.1 OprD family porin [Pseudomonas aeruginosa]MCV0152842.1 OprD family porin [Pseudomonas aeruginosa]MCY0367985.1 OprD family porin [Pseudomonas aeruginosa]MCY0375282.1 OprD family porin [Pseudomonas aeruginosa]